MSSTLERKVFKYGVKPSRRILEKKTFKKALVGGISVAATATMLGASGVAMAADLELSGDGSATITDVTPDADTDNITNNTQDETTDFGEIDVEGNDAAASINVTAANNAELYLYTTTTPANPAVDPDPALTLSGNINVIGEKILVVHLGDKGITSANPKDDIQLIVGGNLSATDNTKPGGTIKFKTMNTAADVENGTVLVKGNVDMSSVDVSAAAGPDDTTNVAAHMTATFGDDDTDTFKSGQLKVTAGAGSADTAAQAGGNVITTVAGSATIGSEGITVTGGNGGDFNGSAKGGNATLTFDKAVTAKSTEGDFVVTGGNGGANNAEANAGNSTINFGGVVYSSRALKITGGNGGALGSGGDATVDIKKSAALGSIVFKKGTAEGTADNAGSSYLTVTGTGEDTQTISGNISTDGDSAGTIRVKNTTGTVSFENTIGTNTSRLKELALFASSKTVFKNAVNAAKLTINGTSAQFDEALNLTGDDAEDTNMLDIADGATIILSNSILEGETVFGDGTSELVVYASGTVTIDVKTELDFGEEIVLFDNKDGSTHGLNLNNFTVTDSDPLKSYTLDGSVNDSSDVHIVVTALTPNTNLLHANINTAVTDASRVMLRNVGDSISSRMNFTRFEKFQDNGFSYEKGFASGDSAGMAPNSWIKTFGNWVNQDTENGVNGYDADIYGFAAGMDAEVAKNVRMGLAFGYSNADVDGKGTSNAQADMDHYQVALYGDYTDEKFYIEGMLGYAQGDNDVSDLDLSDKLREAEFDSEQYTARIAGGIPIYMGDDIFVTPKGSLTWIHLSADKYTSTSTDANAQNLTVNPDDMDAVIASIGAEVHKKIKQDKGYIIPSLYAGISYDLASEEASSTANLTSDAAATTFVANGIDNEEFAGNVGLGLTYEVGQWSVGAKYDGQFKSGQDSHAAALQARFKF